MSAQDDDTLSAAVEGVEADAAAATLAALGTPDGTPRADPQPAAPRRRSGTSRAERKARAAAEPAAPKAVKPRATRATPTKPVDIAAKVTELYTIVGVGVSFVPQLDPHVRAEVGKAFAVQADACGQAWGALAKENDRIRRALEGLLTVSSVGMLLAAHVPIVLAGVQAAQVSAAAKAAPLTA